MGSTAQRVGQGLARRLAYVRHRGDRVACPICESTFARFKDDWNRPDVLCWRCGSHERHRAQWLLLRGRPELLGGARRLLHFAPEHCLRGPLESIPGLEYVTGDLDPDGVDLELDVTGLALEDGAFDALICSHVLEHVPEDAAAMRELRRVTAPGGWCLVLVPLDIERTETYEDPSITTPEARTAAFRQDDHVRLYAPDLAGRLEAAGFAVEVVHPDEEFGAEAMARHRLEVSDWMFLCRAAGEG